MKIFKIDFLKKNTKKKDEYNQSKGYDPYLEIGKLVKEARIQNGFSIKELSDISKIPESSINSIENNIKNLRPRDPFIRSILFKLESLLNTLFKDTENINTDLIPVANAGLKLFVSEKGSEVRKNLLLSLIKDDRLEFKDAEKLLILLRDTFSPLKLAKSAVQNIISPV